MGPGPQGPELQGTPKLWRNKIIRHNQLAARSPLIHDKQLIFDTRDDLALIKTLLEIMFTRSGDQIEIATFHALRRANSSITDTKLI